MHISSVIINHNTAPITVREKVGINTGQLHDSLLLLRQHIPHAIILSTCGRTEIYSVSKDRHAVEEASINFLKSRLNTSDTDLHHYLHIYNNEAAVEHLFRIASGLDSMIIGEFEVLGQVRQALEAAEKARMVNLPLRNIFQSAIRTGRRVREETGISRNALSVSSVAVELAAKVVGDVTNCRILIIGAGETGKLVAKAAKERGAYNIVVINRSLQRATALASTLGGTAVSLNNLQSELASSHIVITCAGAPHWILNCKRLEETMRNRHQNPIVIIDIAVPRNVEPAVGKMNNVFLYNIDDLTDISEENRKQRSGEIQKATEIIAYEMNNFVSWWQALKARPTVSALMAKAENVRRTQLNKTLKKLNGLSDEERHSLEAMTKSIVTKILKDPIYRINASDDQNYTRLVAELFQLDTEKQE